MYLHGIESEENIMNILQKKVDQYFINLNTSPDYFASNIEIQLDKNDISFEYPIKQYRYNPWQRNFNNYNMALVMVEILHEKQLINDATYKKIMKNNQYLNYYSA